MDGCFRTTRRVEFCETDCAGIVHFASFLCYLEQAEHQLLRHVGTSVVIDQPDGSRISWPRVHVECDFQGGAKFEDQLEIEVEVLRLGTKSVTYGHTIRHAGRTIATGKITAVCTRIARGQAIESIEIPDWIRQKLRPFVRNSK